MVQKIKPLITAFSGLVIYSALCISLGYMLSDMIYVRLISKIFVILLGSLYIKTVLQYQSVFDKPSHKYLITAAIAVVVFVFASLFTSSWLVANIFPIETVSTISSENLSLSLFISIVLTPIAEEIIFRGLMYKQLAVYSKSVAIVVSTSVFALYHDTFIHLYTATIGGLILCCIYAKTKKLRYSIIAHSVFNALTLLFSLIDYADWFISVPCIIVINVLCAAAVIALFITKAHDKPSYQT